MESILVDQYSRKSVGVNGGVLLRSYHSLSAAPSLHRSIFDAMHGGAPAYASLPLLPSMALAPPRAQLQPPLLPLPFPKPAARRTAQRKKPRPARRERRAAVPSAKPEPVSTEEVVEEAVEKEEIVFVAARRAVEEEEVEEEKVGFRGSLYSISPPPSSLPLPRFSLKPKMASAAASCTVEALGGGGGCGGLVDSGATDDLRRLLGL